MRIAANMVEAGFAPVMHFLTEDDVDGSIVTDTGHPIGNRPEVIAKFAGPYLDTRSSKIRRLAAPGNFETRNTIVYPVTGGRYEISFQNTPTLQFFSE